MHLFIAEYHATSQACDTVNCTVDRLEFHFLWFMFCN